MSKKFKAAASTSITTSPGPGSGSSTSSNTRALFGSPSSCTCQARIAASFHSRYGRPSLSCPFPLLPGRLTAVHDDRLAGYVVGGARGEEYDDSPYVLWLSEAVHGDVLQHLILKLLDETAAHLRREPAGGDGVDVDAVLGPAGGEVASHGDHGALAGVVADRLHVVGAAADEPGDGGDVHDLTALPSFDHAPPDNLRHQERPPYVDLYHQVKLLERDLFRRCSPRRPTVVDENVYRSEGLFRLS